MSGASAGSNLIVLRLPPDLHRWLAAKAVRERLGAAEIAILALRRMMEAETATSDGGGESG